MHSLYLLISSSRPGSQPANLQGIWSHEIRVPWSSNLTTNINAQMNYWPAEVCKMGILANGWSLVMSTLVGTLFFYVR